MWDEDAEDGEGDWKYPLKSFENVKKGILVIDDEIPKDPLEDKTLYYKYETINTSYDKDPNGKVTLSDIQSDNPDQIVSGYTFEYMRRTTEPENNKREGIYNE